MSGRVLLGLPRLRELEITPRLAAFAELQAATALVVPLTLAGTVRLLTDAERAELERALAALVRSSQALPGERGDWGGLAGDVAQHRYWLELLLGTGGAETAGRLLRRHSPRRYEWFEASNWRQQLRERRRSPR